MPKSKAPQAKFHIAAKKKNPVIELPRNLQQGVIASHAEEIIRALGEDPERDGLLRTPERVEKALRFLTSGYSTDIHKIVNGRSSM